jgi:hypothetical protein
MSAAAHRQAFEEALRSASPTEDLYRLALALRDQGVSQHDLYLLFEAFQVATPGEDPKYDAIVDNMELIWGGPWAKGHGLFPTEISEKALNEYRNKS